MKTKLLNWIVFCKINVQNLLYKYMHILKSLLKAIETAHEAATHWLGHNSPVEKPWYRVYIYYHFTQLGHYWQTIIKYAICNMQHKRIKLLRPIYEHAFVNLILFWFFYELSLGPDSYLRGKITWPVEGWDEEWILREVVGLKQSWHRPEICTFISYNQKQMHVYHCRKMTEAVI